MKYKLIEKNKFYLLAQVVYEMPVKLEKSYKVPSARIL